MFWRFPSELVFIGLNDIWEVGKFRLRPKIVSVAGKPTRGWILRVCRVGPQWFISQEIVNTSVCRVGSSNGSFLN